MDKKQSNILLIVIAVLIIAVISFAIYKAMKKDGKATREQKLNRQINIITQ